MPTSTPRKTYRWLFRFHGDNPVEARQRAERALKAAGFSVGSRQRGAPSGILFGDYSIAKWRNMTVAEREACHGQIFGDDLPVQVTFPPAPPEVDDAIMAMHVRLMKKQADPFEPAVISVRD